MASKINDVAPTVREINIHEVDCKVTIDASGITITRKGDKHQKDKRHLSLTWDKLMDFADPSAEIADPDTYTPAGFLAYEVETK